MSKETEAKKKTKRITIVPDEGKNDQRLRTFEIVRDGYNDEKVLVVSYNPDQMARCINEMLILTSLGEVEQDIGISTARSESKPETIEKPRGKKPKETGIETKEPRFLIINNVKDC